MMTGAMESTMTGSTVTDAICMMPQAAPAQAPDAGNGQPAPPADDAANAPAPQPMFHPVYKVKCYAGSVEYKIRIDAVTGTVLSSEVDVDDDIF